MALGGLQSNEGLFLLRAAALNVLTCRRADICSGSGLPKTGIDEEKGLGRVLYRGSTASRAMDGGVALGVGGALE